MEENPVEPREFLLTAGRYSLSCRPAVGELSYSQDNPEKEVSLTSGAAPVRAPLKRELLSRIILNGGAVTAG